MMEDCNSSTANSNNILILRLRELTRKPLPETLPTFPPVSRTFHTLLFTPITSTGYQWNRSWNLLHWKELIEDH